jgi:hypothetical protein
MQSLFVLKAFCDYCTLPRQTLDIICICEKFEQKENAGGFLMEKGIGKNIQKGKTDKEETPVS